MYDVVRRAAPFAALPRVGLRVGARHAGRPLPVRRVRRAAAAAGVGPGRRHADRPPGRAAAGGHQRRHHPRPRAVRRLPGRETRQSRVGELDEEMVYESRVGDVFTLGSTSWRIEDITHDRVLVTPAPGQPGRLPFWKGDALGRPVELGRALGAFVRELGGLTPADARDRVLAAGLDAWAADNLLAYLASSARPPATCPTTAPSSSSGSATSSATGGWRSTRRSARRCTRRGRWSSPPGCASATASTCRRCTPTTASCCGCPTSSSTRTTAARTGTEIAVVRARRGRAAGHRRGRRVGAVRVPVPRVRRPRPAAAPAQPRPAHARCGSSGSGRRSCSRSPATTARSRSCSRRCASACRTSSTCPGWSALMRDVEERTVRFVEVETQQPSPFARSLLFGYVAQFLYEGDSPLAERRAHGAVARLDPARRAARPAGLRRRCASCSTPTPIASLEPPTCSGCPTTAGPATSRASPTCCGCSDR